MCWVLNPLNAKLNPICHLLALLVHHHILHISRIRVNGLYMNVCVLTFMYMSVQSVKSH